MNKNELKIGDLVRYKKRVDKGLQGSAFLGVVVELRSTGCTIFNPGNQTNKFVWFHLLELVNV